MCINMYVLEGCVAQCKNPHANKKEFTICLLLAWLIEIRELRLFGRHNSLIRVHLVVKFEGVVSVGEVLLCLLLYLCICLNPVKKFGTVTHIFGISHLIILEGFFMAHFFFLSLFQAFR